jgi:hypothetical protein
MNGELGEASEAIPHERGGAGRRAGRLPLRSTEYFAVETTTGVATRPIDSPTGNSRKMHGTDEGDGSIYLDSAN